MDRPTHSVIDKIVATLSLSFAGMVVAAISVFAPVGSIVLTTIALSVFAAALRWPLVGVFTVLILEYGVTGELVPRISMGPGSLNAEDILLPAFTVYYSLTNRDKGSKLFLPATPYRLPILGLISVAALSAFLGVVFHSAPTRDLFIELRPFVAWLVLPLLCVTITDHRRLHAFMECMLLLAVVCAAGALFQSITGIQIFGKGQELRDVFTVDSVSEGVIRSESPAQLLIGAALIFIVTTIAVGQRAPKLLLMMSLFVLTAGTLVGFGRGVWVSIALGISCLLFILPTGGAVRFAAGLIVSAVISAVIVTAWSPSYSSAILNRMTSVSEEITEGSSFARRITENHFALEGILRSPVLGVGLGAPYKPPGPDSASWPDEVRYIHNTYLGVAVKLGLPGLVFVIMLTVMACYRGITSLDLRHPAFPVLFAGTWLIFTSLVTTAATQPNILSPSGVCSIAISLFLIEQLRCQPWSS